MTVKELAQKTAADFLEEMEDAGVNTFQELRRLNWWEPADIREEIAAVAGLIVNADYEAKVAKYGRWQDIPDEEHWSAYIYDDGSVSDGSGDYTYGQFKKMVMDLIKKGEENDDDEED